MNIIKETAVSLATNNINQYCHYGLQGVVNYLKKNLPTETNCWLFYFLFLNYKTFLI